VAALRELGYVEGQIVALERKFANGNVDRLRALAVEPVEDRVDVIVANSTPTARAAKQATTTIPIVAIAMADPTEDELVTRLARPGGNVTGTTFLGPELVSRRLQLLKEIVPRLSRVTVRWRSRAYGERPIASMVKEIESVAQTLGTKLQFVPVAGPDDLELAFAAIAKERPDALIVFPSPMLWGQYARIVNFAANNRLPAGGGVSAQQFSTWSAVLKNFLNEAKDQGLISNPEWSECLPQADSDPLELASSLEQIFSSKVFRARHGDFAPGARPTATSRLP